MRGFAGGFAKNHKESFGRGESTFAGDQRYVTYFRMTARQSYAATMEQEHKSEQAALSLVHRTIDHVRVGEQQPEANHNLRYQHSKTGGGPPPYNH